MGQDTNAVAVNLQLRPAQSVDLCYPTDGIIGYMPSDILGRSVKGIDLASTVYPKLSDTAQSDPSLLLMNASGIYASVSPSLVSALRSEPLKADLDSAIGMRQNAYYSTYSPRVIARVMELYRWSTPGDTESLVMHLDNLLNYHVSLRDLLNEAYSSDGIGWEVVRDTTTKTNIHNTTDGISASTTDTKQVQSVGGSTFHPSQKQQATGSSAATTQGTTTSESRGIEYRSPRYEKEILYHLRSVDLLQERLAAMRMHEMCQAGDGDGVTFANELRSIDLQIRKLQSAYLDTILMSPFDGVVTGVFRQQGDYVTAGQPVARVENDANVYLVGTIKYRSLIKIGYKVSLRTILFDAATNAATQSSISGKVVAVRGHDAIAEQWDVLILCPHRIPGATLFPVNYNFESHNAQIEITPA